MNNSNQSSTTSAGGNTSRINRAETCPSLIRLIWTLDKPTSVSAFNGYPAKGKGMGIQGEQHEVHLYTWPDATLRELFDFVHGAVAKARAPSVRCAFELIHLDRLTGRARATRIGKLGTPWYHDETKTIAALGYRAGDALSVCIT